MPPPNAEELSRAEAYRRCELASAYDLCASFDDRVALLVCHRQMLTVWQRPLDPRDRWEHARPGFWRVERTLAWANDQPFRALPAGATWWLYTGAGELWQLQQGATPASPGAVTRVESGRRAYATVADRDQGRCYIFGDGWYLDLGDDLKEVKEPADKPWPRPDAKASETDKLLVYRGRVDLAEKPKPP